MDLVTREGDRCEMDSHADTTTGGSNFELVYDTGQRVEVSPFSEEYEALQDIPIGTGVTAYDCPKSGTTYLLVFHQMMYFGERLGVSLICPNQIRSHGHKVQDTPTQYDANSAHAILTEQVAGDGLELEIKLTLEGVISRKPSSKELQDCPRITMTSDEQWDPHDASFADEERRVSALILAHQTKRVARFSIKKDRSLHYPSLMMDYSTLD